MLIVGEKEVSDNLVSVRKRDHGDLGQMKIEDFISNIVEEIENKVK